MLFLRYCRAACLTFVLLMFLSMSGCDQPKPSASIPTSEQANAQSEQTAAPSLASSATPAPDHFADQGRGSRTVDDVPSQSGDSRSTASTTSPNDTGDYLPSNLQAGESTDDAQSSNAAGPLVESQTLENVLNRDDPNEDFVKSAHYTPLQIDDSFVLAPSTGIRKLEGKHLTLYTDLPSSEATDRLPDLFDQAYPQWCNYFGLDPQQYDAWHMNGFLIRDREKFQKLGLIASAAGHFNVGYCIGPDLWCLEQDSDWRNGQLLLHEGTHGFMNNNMGSCGPPWYMEGTAELLSTYRVDEDGALHLNQILSSSEEAPYWGRIRLVTEAFQENRARPLVDVLRSSPHEIEDSEDYAWCWALAYMLDRHPRYRDRFHAASENVRRLSFTDRFLQSVRDDWDELQEEWTVFIFDLDFDYDVEANAVDFTIADRFVQSDKVETVKIDAAKGWQNTGLRVEEGKVYEIIATGSYQVEDDPKPWISEPDGVTIRYNKGYPLGMLLAAVRADSTPTYEVTGLARPLPVGSRGTITTGFEGTLYFKINDSAGQLDDNRGQIEIKLRKKPGQ